VLNTIVWVAGLEVPKDGVKSSPLTDADLNANLDDKGGKKADITVPKPGEFKAIPAAPVDTAREAKFPQPTGAAPSAPAAKPAANVPKPLYESPVFNSKSMPRLANVDVALAGAKELHLVVDDIGDKSCDWANWIAPVLIMKDGKRLDLTTVKWSNATTGHGQAHVGKNMEGGPMNVEGKTYTNGIGTHGYSVISYVLPEGVERFQAQVGVDDGAMSRAGQPSDVKLKFAVFTQKPAGASSVSASYDPNAPTVVPPEMFSVPDGLEVTVWATSPLFSNPTNIDFDADGRLYVAEGVNYRGKGGRRQEGDRIMVLEDTDGDGKADKSEVFVQEPGLASPLGVAVLDDKIIVAQPPDLLVYTDTNRDRKFDPAVDKREVLLTGFAGRQHDHSLHSLTAGPDGQWYFNQGNAGAEFTDRSGKTFRMGSPYMLQQIAGQRSDDGHVWIGGFTVRMNPDGTNVKIMGHNYRNSYEQAVTSFGDLFQSDNDDPPACRVSAILEGGNAGFASADGLRSWGADKRPGQETPVAQWRQEDPGTMPAGDVYGGGSPTGVAFYENGVLGDEWRGLLLACEAGKNVVFGYLPKPDGAGWKLERIDFITSNKEKEWAGSDFLGGKASGDLKTMFRPSDVCVGPDGAIYVADWYDARVGGHGTMDDGMTGTIYRIAPKGFKSVVPKFDLATIEGQIAALQNPSPNVRNLGFTRLKAQGEKAVSAVSLLLDDKNPYIAARAVWLLAQMGDAGIAKVKPLLQSKDDTMRLVAYRALRFANHEVLTMADAMATDASAAVRREVAVTLREVPLEKSLPILVKLAKGFDGKDRAYLEAFGLGCDGKEREVYAAVAKEMGGEAMKWSDAFAWIAWRLHPPEAVSDFKTRALSSDLNEEQRKLMVTALAFTQSREAAGAMIELANTKDFPMKDLAQWWLFNRKGNDWKAYDVEGGMKALGLYDPAKVKLSPVVMPPVPADAKPLPAGAEIVKIAGDVTRGQAAIAVCYTCHKVGTAGIDFGPDLTTFGLQQPAEVIADAIAHPSKEISHGFEGSEVTTKDGLTITGMVLSGGDPLIIKCMGGLVQTVPQERIASVKKMDRSLMYEAANLGLTAQGVSDIVAYLKSLKPAKK
jgi:putative membrane-bound dehydrogenase-like protein